MKKDTIYILLIFGLVLLVNLLLFQGCCLNNDSYFYLANHEIGNSLLFDWITNFPYWVFFIIHIGVLFIITAEAYSLFKDINSKYSFLLTVMFMFDPFTIFNTQLGLMDKNIFVVLFVLIGINIARSPVKWRYIILALFTFVVALFWRGWPVYLFVMLIITCFHGWRKEKLIGIALIPVAVAMGFLLFKPMIVGLDFVRELLPALSLFTFMYFFYVIIFIYKMPIHIYLSLLFVTLCFLVIFRFNIFFIPVIYYALASVMNVKNYRWFAYFYIIFAILSFPAFGRTPMHEPFLPVLEAIEEDPRTCIVADWGDGHILNYLSDKQILYSAHPHYNKLVDLSGAYMNCWGVEKCIILWRDDDVQTYQIIAEKIHFEYDEICITNTSRRCYNEFCYI